MRRLAPLFAIALLALVGCGGDDADPGIQALPPDPKLETQAKPPATAAAMTSLPVVPRVGFVNVDRLDEVSQLLPADDVRRRVLGSDVRAAARTVVALDGATVLDPAARREIRGGDAAIRRKLADPTPTVNAIMPSAQSAAQSCLGDTAAQTLIGPGELGEDTALGVGVRASKDAPAGVQVLICWAPHFARDLHTVERRIKARYGDLSPKPVIGEVEIGERETLSAILPADALPKGEALRLLAADETLRSLVPGR